MEVIDQLVVGSDLHGKPARCVYEVRVDGGRLFVGVNHLVASTAAPSLLFVPDAPSPATE